MGTAVARRILVHILPNGAYSSFFQEIRRGKIGETLSQVDGRVLVGQRRHLSKIVVLKRLTRCAMLLMFHLAGCFG